MRPFSRKPAPAAGARIKSAARVRPVAAPEFDAVEHAPSGRVRRTEAPSRRLAVREAAPQATALVLLMLSFGVAPSAGSGADQSGAEQPAAEMCGYGESYWGPIPARADSVSLAFRRRSTPVWQHVVDLPWHVAGYPLSLAVDGIGAAVVYLDDHQVAYHVSQLLGPREIPWGFLVNVSYGGLVGAGGGATFLHDRFFGEDNRFRLGFNASVNGHARVTSGLRFHAGHPTEIQLGAGYRLRPNARYFGVGPDASRRDRSYYRQELGWVGVESRHALGHGFAVEPGVLFSEANARGPRDEDKPPLAERFSGELPPGYHDRSDGAEFSVGLVHDSTTETGRPSGSGYRRVSISYFAATSDDRIFFWTYRAELQQFIPLWYSYRALALRGFWSWIDPTSGVRVPFQRLMTNDDPDLLRGFEDFRWRDRGMIVFTAEHRWPVWAASYADDIGLDAYLFSDIGQVFGKATQISMDNVTTSYGLGLRLISHAGFVGRIEIAHSREENVLRFRADQVFQFQKGDLFHGRNPVPSR